MHQIHHLGVNGDVCGAEGSDGCGESIEAHEMHIDIAVILEGCGDRYANGKGTVETIEKGVDLLPSLLANSRSTVVRSKSWPLSKM